MFETVTAVQTVAARRAWTTCAGMTAEAVLLTAAVLVPLVFPGAMPKTESITTWLMSPVSPTRVEPVDAERRAAARVTPVRPFRPEGFYEPQAMPAQAQIIEDPPAEDLGFGFPRASASTGLNAVSSLVGEILELGLRSVAAPPKAEPVPPREAPPTLGPTRVILGGDVKEAILVRRVEPVYPVLAARSRISGVVELDGVIGTDGRVRELRPLTGNPLLVPAAVTAVRQWLYKPTVLNGEPVEVALTIAVTFRLK